MVEIKRRLTWRPVRLPPKADALEFERRTLVSPIAFLAHPISDRLMGAYPVSPIFFGNGITSAVVGAYRLMSRIWFTVSVSGCSHR